MFNFFFAFLEPFFLLPNCHGGFSKKNLHIYIFLYGGNYRVGNSFVSLVLLYYVLFYDSCAAYRLCIASICGRKI